MLHRFSRLVKVIGEEDFSILNKSKVLVLGCGGVGGYVVEALARSGVGTIIIVDFDAVDETNINRQIIALESTIGLNKVDVLESRIKEINRDCNIIKVNEFITVDTVDKLFDYEMDFFVDACDTTSVKKEIIRKCINRKIKFISCMGTGNKLDPSKLEIVDIRRTSNDPLARMIRKFVKDEKINSKVMVLCSSEVPVKTGDRTPGSTAFVPPAAGLMIASYVVKKLLNK